MANLTGKRALVTGGSRGIGAAIARRFAEEGADVAITFQTSSDDASSVVADIEALGRCGIAIAANAGVAEDVRTAIEKTVWALGGLDILVNNAGVTGVSALDEMAVEDIQLILDVNVRGAILATRSALPHLSAGGRIINIGSILADRVPFPGVSVYAASKAGLAAFTKGLARELASKDVTVNIIHPGSTDTSMNPADGPNADLFRSLIPLGRFNDATDVAALAAFLAGPEGRQITGTALTIDGGVNA